MLRTFWSASMVLCLAAVPEAVQEGPPSTGTIAERGPGPAFQGIGDLPGGSFHSEALTVSENGRIVAGRSSSSYSDEEGLILTRREGLVPLLEAGGAHVPGEPRAITHMGHVVGGKIVAGGALRAARWTAATGWVALPDLPGGDVAGQALGISASGDVLVGWSASSAGLEAARWVNGQVFAMGDLPGGPHHSAAALVSADGTTIVGTGTSGSGPEVFVWQEGTGMIGLGDLPGGAFSSEPFGMNHDASVIVGESTSSQGVEAMRWSSSTGMQGLGDLPGGEFQSMAFDVSANGQTVVGFGTTERGAEAFVWTAKDGMRRVLDVLLEQGGSEAQGWLLTEATSISANGHVVVGNGTNPNGQTEGWIAYLR